MRIIRKSRVAPVTVLLGLICLLGLTGCGNTGKENVESPKAEEEVKEVEQMTYDDSDSMGLNPILPLTEYIPDGEPRVFGDRVYIYGSHDEADGTKYCVNDYVVYSAPTDDLGNWKFEGYSYKKSQDPQYVEGKDMALYAPDVIQGKDGKYYLYYCMEPVREVAVAVSDSPAGPFEYYGLVHYADGSVLGREKGDWSEFDTAIFIDDDGTIYLYSGNGSRQKKEVGVTRGCHVMTLEDDMLTIKTEPVKVLPNPIDAVGTPFENHGFFEATSIRKKGDTYYLVYSSEAAHELCYAYSKSPDKDFVYGGVLVSNGNIFEADDIPKYQSGNNHGGMVCINEQWYIFYHRHTSSRNYSRVACAEPINFDENGLIAQVEITTSGFASRSAKVTDWISAGRVCEVYGTFETLEDYDDSSAPCVTQEGEDGAEDAYLYVRNIRDGYWIAFKYFNVDGIEKIRISTRGEFTGTVEILDDENGSVKGSIQVSPSADWVEAETTVTDMSGESGIYLRARGEGILEIEKMKMVFEN